MQYEVLSTDDLAQIEGGFLPALALGVGIFVGGINIGRCVGKIIWPN